jgi:DNA (cytosine-5)-methyltransferase 1
MQNIQRKINLIDLFAGCGGLSYGFSSLDYNILLGIDNDPIALKTFKYNHKNSETICNDINKIGENEIIKSIGNNKIDLIIGGPPCQGMSISGNRELDDPRNELFLSFVRITEELKPKAFLLENVPGLLGLFNGKLKDAIIEEFSKIGYNVKYQILNAKDYGVPQNRKRVIFIGFLDSSIDYVFPSPNVDFITSEDAISDLPEYNVIDDSDYICLPLTKFQEKMRLKSNRIFNHQITKHKERTQEIISYVPDGGNYKDLPIELQNSRKVNIAWTRLNSKKQSFTIDTGHRHHFHYKYNRIPTVRECARLQSFPDDFIFFGNKTSQYKQVGNAVPPILANVIAQNLLKYL